MENLIKILEKFEENRKKRKNNKEIKWYEKTVAECFKPCAEEILCNGYFLVNNKYIIDLGAIELYYHEEEGNIKDYIMYHINDNPKNKSKVKILENGSVPYFKIGRFHFHQSGIDVTFENEDEKYRAAFLIRSYRVLKADNGKYPKDNHTKYDPHSTHIFDDMFYGGVSLGGSLENEIKWVPFKKREINDMEPEPIARVNVPIMFMTDGGKIEKKESVDSKSEGETIKSGKKTYVKDTRKWQFKLKNISEEK
ncbi:MAG: hypothetical protein J6T28_04580 [Paludibacteraceae bacterium]|nr:hypothetical protein [Paludibacteraceae bacterium]